MALDEYIKKETAYRVIMGERPEAREPSWFAELVLEIPAVDAVEVVRCRDCKYSTLPSAITQRYGEPGTLTCHNWKSPCNRRNVKSDGFCPCGERRTDG